MNAVVEEVSKQYEVQVPWGGAVMKMLCHDEYKFWRSLHAFIYIGHQTLEHFLVYFFSI